MDKKVNVAAMTQEYLNNCENVPDLRTKSSVFRRHRKLYPKRLLLILLRRPASCLQLGVDRFFDYLEEETVSKQAFSKVSANLNLEYVRKFADGIAGIHTQDPDAPSYCGMRLIGRNGYRPGNQSGVERGFWLLRAKARDGSLDCAIYDCQIASYAADERDLAKLHMTRLQELGLGGSLLPSAVFLDCTLTAGFSFMMRVRKKWNLQAGAVENEGSILLSHEGREFSVWVLKAALSSGEIEALLTNLSEEQLPLAQAADLYFKRWTIETACDTLKSKLQLENFSGKTEISVRQDFYAAVYIAGSYLRDRFWLVLLEEDPALSLLLSLLSCAAPCLTAFAVTLPLGLNPSAPFVPHPENSPLQTFSYGPKIRFTLKLTAVLPNL